MPKNSFPSSVTAMREPLAHEVHPRHAVEDACVFRGLDPGLGAEAVRLNALDNPLAKGLLASR